MVVPSGARGDRRIDEILDAAQLRESLAAALRQIDRLKGVPALAEAPTIERVEAILRARRLRGRFFDPQLFADPAWDILLELYAAELKCIRMTVSELCIGAAVPPTTALRWMRSLEQKDLVRRNPDHVDSRRVYVSLSPEGKDRMTKLLESCPATEALL